ncbi:MAG: ABC transporter permease [Armatimonadetes bacterium]|nr:ABC transporter permease [Armatimonadota bacterium]
MAERLHPLSGFLRRVRAIARKEAIHLLREPRTVLVSFAQPVMLLILYGYCITFDLHNIPFAVWDQDRSEAARQLVRPLSAGAQSHTFWLVGYIAHPREIEPLLATARARFVLVIPRGFGADVAAGRTATVQALFDAADSNTAGVSAGYLVGAIAAHNARLATYAVARRHGAHVGAPAPAPSLAGGDTKLQWEPIDLRWRVFYNPDLASRRFIIPGLIGMLLTILAATLTSTTIARERELGSLETILTSPVGAGDLVIGKMAPYVLVAAANVVMVLVVGGLMFGTWARGNLLTLASLSLLFLLGMLALGMLISARAPNQQQALLFAILATMLPTFFLTGFTFPRSNMPWILQAISWPLPATQYLIAIRGVFLKGIGWRILWPQGLWMAITTLVLLIMATRIMRVSLARGLE